MRCCLLFVAVVASAQQPDPRGFVNERLLRQNFAKNALNAAVAARKAPAAGPATCAIPLLEVPLQKDVDRQMILPQGGKTGDEKMILPTIPVCPKR